MFGPMQSVAFLNEFGVIAEIMKKGGKAENEAVPANINSEEVSTFVPSHGFD